MSEFTTSDGTQIFYKDWGAGQPIVFSHGWPLSGDDWDAQMLFFLLHGYRVIAHDRRGHGRSAQPSEGNDVDHYADDLAELTLAFALRRDMDWIMAGVYWVVQFAAAICGSLLARAFFGPAGNLAATMPKPGQSWQAAGFEAIITFGLILMILNLANGPKLNGPFIPLAVGAYILAWGTMGGPYEGASMNPARSFGPDVAIGDLSTWWVYLVGPVAGAVLAVGVAYVLRGPAKVGEASAAEGTPLDRAS